MEVTLLIKFLFGVLLGFVIAYPLGLWAGYYTDWINRDGK
jgi:ABC-type dipeptide/oligopeptide/nickel transport system permease subunit